MLTTTGEGATIMKHEFAKFAAALPYGVVPFFQPIVGLRDGSLTYEALGRLIVDGKVVSPGQFMPYFEGTPLMAEFDREVTAKSISTVAVWNARRSNPLHLHVNVGQENLLSGSYAHFLREMLSANQFSPHHLTVEVVESCSFWRDERMCNALRDIRRLGVCLAIDDFPCWEDPAALLQFLAGGEIGFTTLKLDRSVVSAFCLGDAEPAQQALLLGYIRQARLLNLTVVAEGVEDPDHLVILDEIGVDAVQGFAIGRPAAATSAYHLTAAVSTPAYRKTVPIMTSWSTNAQ